MIIAIFSFLLVIGVSMLVTRLAAMALILTGLSQEAARFQARSALTGVGFTTSESEAIVNHPVRRRIIMLLMLTGNIGVPTMITTMVVSFMTTVHSEHWWWPTLLFVTGLTTLMVFGKNRWVERRLNAVLLRWLKQWTRLDVRDYVSLLQLQNGYAVTELLVKPGDWIDGKTLRDAALSHEGVLVLGIQRQGGTYVGTPLADDQVGTGDTLLLYSRIDRLKELDQRGAMLGELAHRDAVAAHAAQTRGPA